MKKAIAILGIILLPIFVMVFAFACCSEGVASSDAAHFISTRDDLMLAINNAVPGDTLYVSDIDFTPASPDEYLTGRKITIDKDITIIGTGDQPVIFRGGMLDLVGSKVSGEKLSVRLENIAFDGTIDTPNLTTDTLPDDGYYGNAISFAGNVDCSVTGCSFSGYYGVDGSVFEIRYADYTASEYYSSLYPDYSGCRLELTLTSCLFENNRAFYTGGAIMLDANRNVHLSLADTTLRANKSGAYYGMGGGAIYASGAFVDIKGSRIVGNQGNYCYPLIGNYYPMDEFGDNARGGALHLIDCELSMQDSIVAENIATRGGGISLTNTKADFDGVTLAENRAERCADLADNASIAFPGSIGQGGALYTDGDRNLTVLLLNSTVVANTAELAYPGVFAYYGGPIADMSRNLLKLAFCTYANNTCDATYDYTSGAGDWWTKNPGDLWTDPNTTLVGCIMLDDSFGDFHRNEAPTADNGYNLIGMVADVHDALTVAYDKSNNYGVALQFADDEAWVIPQEVSAPYTARYASSTAPYKVGSNYVNTLYRPDTTPVEPQMPGEPDQTSIIVHAVVGTVLALVVVAGIAVSVIIIRKKRVLSPEIDTEAASAANDGDSKEPHAEEDAAEPRAIIITRYTYEEANAIMQAMTETQSLTQREKEVLREMILGKKQTEIAVHLVVTVSTIKDFYRKIYDKLGVDNKAAFLDKIVAVAQTVIGA